MGISNLIQKLIWVGIALGWSGTLVEVIDQLMHESAKTQIMSLGDFNRSLLGQPHKKGK